MNRRIYYDTDSGIIIMVTDGRQTVPQEVALYRIAGYLEGETATVQLEVTAYMLRNLKNYRVNPEEGTLIWSGEGPEPTEPGGGGGGGGAAGIDAEARRLVGELAIEVEEVRGVAEQAKTQAVDGKAGLSAALIDRGIPASPTDTFAVLAAKIGDIVTHHKIATGVKRATSQSEFSITGLDFVPRLVFGKVNGGTQSFMGSTDGTLPNNGSTTNNFTASAEDGSITLTGTSQFESTFTTGVNYHWLAVE